MKHHILKISGLRLEIRVYNIAVNLLVINNHINIL